MVVVVVVVIVVVVHRLMHLRLSISTATFIGQHACLESYFGTAKVRLLQWIWMETITAIRAATTTATAAAKTATIATATAATITKRHHHNKEQ